MPLTTNTTKQRLAAGKMALGFGVHHLRTVAAPVLAAATGHDWMFIDTEHGAFNVQETTQLCIAALPTGVTPIVRVCAGALDEATRALDNGALGIVVPHVDTEAEAKRIAAAFHYPPMGTRSWGGPPASIGYQPPSTAEAQAAINAEILTVVMLESPEAIAQRRCHRRCPRRRRAVHRHLRPDRGTGYFRSDGPSEGDRRLSDRRRRLPQAWQDPRHGRRLRRGKRFSLRRHGRAFPADRLGPQLHHVAAPASASAFFNGLTGVSV